MARLHLTGGLRLEGPGGAFDDGDMPGNQARIAFAALAVERRPVAHDALAEIVWDGEPPAAWRSALAPVMSKLRTLVSSTGLEGPSVLASIGGAYRLVLPADVFVDVEEAVKRLDRAEGSLRAGAPTDCARDATVAAGILRRPFLAGIDNVWADGVRRRLDDARYRSGVVLADAWNELGHHRTAATIAAAAIDLDPLRESAYRSLIVAERGRGDDAAAVRTFDRCASTLAAELGVVPSPTTRALVDDLPLRR